MYELEPKDAHELARMLGEIDHDTQLKELKQKQERIKLELLQLKKEKAQQEQQRPTERQNDPPKRKTDITTIIALTCSMLSALVPFVLMLFVFARY